MKKIELPTRPEAMLLVAGEYYDAIDKFVCDRQPGGDAEEYRKDLQAALQEAYERGFKDGDSKMTDQYKELRLAASHVPDVPWAKQALQLLDEMEAVGAGGVSGKPLTKDGGIGWIKKISGDANGIPTYLQLETDRAESSLRDWVDLINQTADDETKAILRMGLKEEIERMFSQSVDHPSAYRQNKWFDWPGGENPAPGCLVEFKIDGGSAIYRSRSAYVRWSLEGGGDVTSYRIVK